jgi:hypothetical protein
MNPTSRDSSVHGRIEVNGNGRRGGHMGKRRTELTRFNFPEVSDQETDFFVEEARDVDAQVGEEPSTDDRAEVPSPAL